MRAVAISLILVLQTGLVLLAGVPDAAADGSSAVGKPTIVPIDRTHVRLALPERPPQSQPRSRAPASPAPAGLSAPLLPPAVRAQ